MAGARDELLRHLSGGDRSAAAAVVGRARAHGLASEAVIAELLGPVMAEVGRRWLTGEWTVAQEHAATSVVDALLGALELEPAPVTAAMGTVVAVCATGEWHVTPLRMFAELLRRQRWNVRVLGASVPPDHLTEHLARHPGQAVVLSCSVARYLPGAAAVVAAAHRGGVPVLAGGAAFGADDRRARAIGADGWAPDVVTASAVLAAWCADPPSVRRAPVVPAPVWGPVTARRVAAVVQAVAAAGGDIDAVVVEELAGEVLAAADAAAACGDETVLADELRWAAQAPAARLGGGPEVLVRVVEAVAEAEPSHADVVRLALHLAGPIADDRR